MPQPDQAATLGLDWQLRRRESQIYGTLTLASPDYKSTNKEKLEIKALKKAYGWMRCTNVEKEQERQGSDVTGFGLCHLSRGLEERTERARALKPEQWTEACVLVSYFQKSLIVTVT